MRRKVLLMAVLSIYAVILSAQTGASNIRTVQQDSLLCIIYDLSAKSDISVYFSKDDGMSFIGPLENVAGDVGNGVERGKNKLITWRVTQEIGYVDISTAKVKIVANALAQVAKTSVPVKKERRLAWRNLLMVGASLSEHTPLSYSVMYGRYKRFGYYAKAETNFRFMQKTDYDATGLSGYHREESIFFNGTGNLSRVAIYGGGIWNFNKYAMLNLGIGYSNQTVIADAIGNQKVKNDAYNDMNVELGIIVSIKCLSLAANAFFLPTHSGDDGTPIGGNLSVGINF